MRYIDWPEDKNQQLKRDRGINFEQVLVAIEAGNILDIVEHHNPKQYPDQKIFIIAIANYVYLVPFVEDDEKVFLKTIIPSRKATKKYLTFKK